MKRQYICPLVESGKIQEATLHVRKPIKERLYFLPFIIGYSAWVMVVSYLVMAGKWDELWYVPMVILAFIHGLIILACQWSVKIDATITCREVGNIKEAELIKVIPREHGGKAVLTTIQLNEKKEEIWFMFQRQKFVYDEERKTFRKLKYPTELLLGEYTNSSGLTDTGAVERGEYYGANRFEMPIPTFFELFKEHAIAPFFVFQVFCVGLWCLDEYWYYSIFTLAMLVVFESTVVQQRLKNMNEFRTMSLPNIDVMVKRSGAWVQIKSEQLIPGDLAVLEFGGGEGEGDELTLPCDLLLIAGTCIINEAMISGESTPMLKEAILETRQMGDLDRSNLNFITDRNHILFGGTKVLQITAPTLTIDIPKCTDKNRCLVYVLRTGFGTLQGKLVRTMMFTSERITANNFEAFAFILFLLVFAIVAAAYVLYHAWDDEKRSRVKLLLECVLIITAVVPPELPMELSLAVNNSLMALSKFAVYCMEPFRIPLAGKVDICCFDKTGTLTGENLVVQGVAGLTREHEAIISNHNDLPIMTSLIIATCHSLFRLEGKKGTKERIVGDPMEKTALEFVNWNIANGDNLIVKKETNISARILHRFPFSSILKRMSCVVQSTLNDKRAEVIITCKGAPEVIESMLTNIPPWYKSTYTRLAHHGARVLSLAYKTIPHSSFSVEKAKQFTRGNAEQNLIFAGFLVFHCPLKPDSRKALLALKESQHHVVMITGDNVLTAVHTAYELEMIKKPSIMLDLTTSGQLRGNIFDLRGSSSSSPVEKEFDLFASNFDRGIFAKFDVAITGDAFDYLVKRDSATLNQLMINISVFARASPSQKELILMTYKSLGYTTLMCGDGTNDVGALKQAHVGIALLDGKPEDLLKILKQMQTVALRKRQIEIEKSRLAIEQRFGTAAQGNKDRAIEMQSKIEQLTTALEQDEVPMVRLGDASVAAPFTSKISTIEAVCNLVRQGRCTLVTTMQMYKILALNSLISAYGLSVLHLEGIRYGDFQVTITGMLLAGCFLFLSRAQPMEKLAASRPQPNIFNWYVLTSVLLQFCLHVGILYCIVRGANRWSFRIKADENTKFVPGLLNTAVYLISLLMQVSTFVVNYQGRPFRESLAENKPLRNSLMIVSGISIIAALELYPEFNEWLQLVRMPPKFRNSLVSLMVLDFGGCLIIEHLCKRFLFDARPKIQ